MQPLLYVIVLQVCLFSMLTKSSEQIHSLVIFYSRIISGSAWTLIN